MKIQKIYSKNEGLGVNMSCYNPPIDFFVLSLVLMHHMIHIKSQDGYQVI